MLSRNNYNKEAFEHYASIIATNDRHCAPAQMARLTLYKWHNVNLAMAASTLR